MNNELKKAHARLLTVAKTLHERVDDPEVALAAYESMQDELCAAWSLAERLVGERDGEPGRADESKDTVDPLPEKQEDDGMPF